MPDLRSPHEPVPGRRYRVVPFFGATLEATVNRVLVSGRDGGAAPGHVLVEMSDVEWEAGENAERHTIETNLPISFEEVL